MIHRPDEWLKYVKMHIDDGVPMTHIAAKYELDISKLKYKVKLYRIHGEWPLTDEQAKRVYTREEKLTAIQEVLTGNKSGRQVALEMGIPGADTVNDWIKLYKEKGPDAIQISKGRRKYLLHEDRQAFLADKELREKLEHLEAENEYLKKSLALASKKNKRLKKKYKSFRSSRAVSN